MKKIVNFAIIALLMIAGGCASDMPAYEKQISSQEETVTGFGYSKAELIDLGSKTLNGSTRTGITEVPTIEPLYSPLKTRGNEGDVSAMAYVLNYPESNKFVVVANDKRMNPILAYSDEGTFNKNDENIQDIFINNIPAYMTASISGIGGGFENDSIISTTVNYTGIPVVGPMNKSSVHCGEPFNKYIKEHSAELKNSERAMPMAIAAFYAVSQKYDTLTYMGNKYMFKLIRTGLAHKNSSKREYDYAVENVAKFLYDFERDAFSQFDDYYFSWQFENKEGSFLSGISEVLREMLIYKFNISCPGGMDTKKAETSFDGNNIKSLFERLDRGRLIVARSENYYYWMIDGYSYNHFRDNDTVQDLPCWSNYLHCRWGSDKMTDGYYHVGVLNEGETTVKFDKFFEIR